MTLLEHPAWFCRWTPTNIIGLHPTLEVGLRDGVGWFEVLVKDIEKNGMMNPILVQSNTMPGDEANLPRVAHGCNRFRAALRLGLRYVPTIIVGQLPLHFLVRGHGGVRIPRGAVELHTLEDAQQYVLDGTFVNNRAGCKILNALPAESMTYLRRSDPYFDGTPDHNVPIQ